MVKKKPAHKNISPEADPERAANAIKQFKADAARLESIAKPTMNDEETNGIAAGFWLGAIAIVGAVGNVSDYSETEISWIRQSMYVAHVEAWLYLARLADGLGLDGNAIKAAGPVREMFIFGATADRNKAIQIYQSVGHSAWQDYLKAHFPNFPDRQQRIIDAGQAVFDAMVKHKGSNQPSGVRTFDDLGIDVDFDKRTIYQGRPVVELEGQEWEFFRLAATKHPRQFSLDEAKEIVPDNDRRKSTITKINKKLKLVGLRMEDRSIRTLT